MIGNDPKTIDYFKQQRPELYNYVLNDVIPENKKFKLVPAPVKSGKRGMVEVHSLLDKESSHIFLTALHRTADENQRNELASYGIKVFSINNTKKKNECIKYIDDQLALGKEIKPHLDELDFGCGDKQLLNYIYSAYKNNPHVTFILYSATIEVAKKEFLVVNNIEEFHECKPFNPPPTYFGIKKFLDKKKFQQATPFVTYDCNNESIKITTQGENLIKKLKENTNNTNNKRHIAVLRLAGNFKTNGKSISQFDTMKENSDYIEEKYGIRLKFVGSNDNSVEWDNLKTWGDYNPAIPYIFVINQVAGRSTEWKCHPYLVWYHTMRTEDTPTSTIIQDQERPVYYTINYTDDIDIEIYGDVPSAQYSAGIITLEQYDSMSNRKINARLNTKNQKKHIKVKQDPLWFNSWAEIPEEYTKNRTLSSHVKPEYKLKEFMTTNNKSYQIKNWDKYNHLEGFYMTNIRSSISEFIKGTSKKTNLKPIWFRSDLLNELGEGIDEKTKIRINLFYEDNETNPNNYKFMIREYESSEVAEFDNTSMYNK
jgi:hypothetical protein